MMIGFVQNARGRLIFDMTDEELLNKTSAALGAAHRAPFAEWSMDHHGHSSIVNHTDAWAKRSKEFMDLIDECLCRGLKPPKCDCPPDAHKIKKKATNG